MKIDCGASGKCSPLAANRDEEARRSSRSKKPSRLAFHWPTLHGTFGSVGCRGTGMVRCIEYMRVRPARPAVGYASDDGAAALCAKTGCCGVGWCGECASTSQTFHHTRDPATHTRYHRRDGLYKSIHGTCVELGSTGKYDGSHAYTFLRPRDVGGARRHVAHPQWL